MFRCRGPLTVLMFIAGFSLFIQRVSFAEEKVLEGGTIVKAIEIQGNQRIETSTILARIKLKVGSPLSADAVREDINSLYQLGFFLDVRVDSEPTDGGVKVIYHVTERPYISEINFVGNAEIMSDKLKEKLTIKPKTFLDDVQVKQNAEVIRQYYDEEGYYSTVVIPVLKEQEDHVDLIYYIKEGAKATINKINFNGDKAYPPSTLMNNIESKQYNLLTSWLTSSGYYKKELLNEDVDKLKDFYLNNAYLQIQVGNPEVKFKEDRSQTLVTYPILHGEIDYPYEFHTVGVTLAFPLIEGDQFRVRKIIITGNTVFTTEQVRAALKLKEGDLFRRNVLREGVGAIHDDYGEKGYLYANVIPQYTSNTADKTVDLTLDISEDHRMRVREIIITGNDKTRDKVIRREMRLDEQDWVDTKLLRRSFQRINNLNFFESVEIVPNRVSLDQVDLETRVKEKSTGTFSVGGGYSSVDRLVAMVDITQGNLFGRGQLLRARAEVGSLRNTYSLTFREPYLFDSPISGTVDLFNQARDFTSYNERRIGGDVVFGKSFTEYISGSLNYTHETLTIYDVQTDAPSQIQSQTGRSVTSSVGATIAHDTRDFYFDPKEGSRVSLSSEFAGLFLGGTNNFVKSYMDAIKFYPVIWDTVFSLHGRFGYATGINGTPLPIGENYYVGGINTVRGFKFGGAGPIDPVTGDVLGGSKELIFNAELLLPLVPAAKIKLVLFYDAGSAFSPSEWIYLSDLRLGAGFGLRWLSPIGPLRLEWGHNIHQRPGEKSSSMDFTIGTVF